MSEQVFDIITLWAPSVLLILSIDNTLTKHYTKFNGVLRIVMSIVERISFLASKQTGRKLKAPGSSVIPSPVLEKLADYESLLKSIRKNRRANEKS